MSAPNHQLPLQNNGMGMQNQPQMGVATNQNQNLMPPFMPNMQPSINVPPFMNATNHHLPLQTNQLQLPHMGMAGPLQGRSHVGFGPQNGVSNAGYNPIFPVQGQAMHNAAQINLSQLQGILAQSILNMLQQPNVNMNVPNGQFCAPFPVQNMNQQLPMQVPNVSQVVPYGMHPGSGSIFGFQSQVPQAMVPQNPMFSANPQMGIVPGNQVRPQVDQNDENLIPPNGNTNALVSSTFSSQQLQRNSSALLNPSSIQVHSTNNSQPSAFTKSHSQANPNSNTKTNVPNSNWKGSPSKNFKNKQNRGGFQGGFQKSKFHDINNGKRKTEFPKEHKSKGLNNGRAGHLGLNPKEHMQEPKRSFSVTYTEQEIQQWREARRKNHPFSNNIRKKQSDHRNGSKVIDRAVLHKELKQVLAKQAELGIEVAEIPPYYLKDSETHGLQSEKKNTFTDKRKFQNKFNKRSDQKGWSGKKQKFVDNDSSEGPSLSKRKPTLLQKLLSADVKRDKSHLLQVFRFMVINSFFKECPDKPLIYPSVVVKDGSEGGAEEKNLHAGKDVLDTQRKVKKIVNRNNDNVHVSEDEEGDDDDDENDYMVHINQLKEPSSLIKRQCHNGVGVEKSDQEEGEITD